MLRKTNSSLEFEPVRCTRVNTEARAEWISRLALALDIKIRLAQKKKNV